jgi:hypothetical protein
MYTLHAYRIMQNHRASAQHFRPDTVVVSCAVLELPALNSDHVHGRP